MTPLLPREPRRAASESADSMEDDVALRADGLSSSAFIVRNMLMPVSPSGTGNTLRALMASIRPSRAMRPCERMRCSPCGSRYGVAD